MGQSVEEKKNLQPFKTKEKNEHVCYQNHNVSCHFVCVLFCQNPCCDGVIGLKLTGS